MGLQAGLPSLFFGDISGKKRRDYFVAIRAGLDKKYEPMQRIMGKIIAKTLEIHHQT
jgi:cell filamentation protein